MAWHSHASRCACITESLNEPQESSQRKSVVRVWETNMPWPPDVKSPLQQKQPKKETHNKLVSFSRISPQNKLLGVCFFLSPGSMLPHLLPLLCVVVPFLEWLLIYLLFWHLQLYEKGIMGKCVNRLLFYFFIHPVLYQQLRWCSPGHLSLCSDICLHIWLIITTSLMADLFLCPCILSVLSSQNKCVHVFSEYSWVDKTNLPYLMEFFHIKCWGNNAEAL